MKKIYDVFKRLPEGPLWVQAVEGVDEARSLVTLLCSKSAGSYFVFDTSRSEVVAEASSAPLSSVGLARAPRQPASFNPNRTP